MSLLLAFSTALLFSLGTYLLLQRRLSRLIVGLGLMGHGANLLLLLSGGRRGVAPFIGATKGERVADPMPQALALTAIVISFGVTAFLLALAFRSWQLTGDDLVEDDVEDRRIAGALAALADEEVADIEAMAAAGADAEAGGPALGEEDGP
ncbi:NADH-quinone oxidoreductase subunit K [Aquihabitans sp. G128]|uniref:sodium:proton antiporter n=1 Tax=Aquihabitans sp. G128 TaxID=2849779 RepID=UPI001C24BFBD|nr:NADH-quinone oxidoreductase subunit K [Aquihabitans sp. G128]QXC59658.1 NADH-quinone oxidoreductase subunit K [Aquihabitans sp. G128]